MSAIAPSLRRIAFYGLENWGPDRLGESGQNPVGLCERLSQMGFDSILVSAEPCLEQLRDACLKNKLALFADMGPPDGESDESNKRWLDHIRFYSDLGVVGVRCRGLGDRAATQWRYLRDAVRDMAPGFRLLAWTPGISAERLREFEIVGFDGCFSSLPWWDQRSAWLTEEYERLQRVAPVIAPCSYDHEGQVLDPRLLVDDVTFAQRLWVGAYLGQGMMVDARRACVPGFSDLVQHVNDWLVRPTPHQGRPVLLSGPLSPATIMFWSAGAEDALILHVARSSQSCKQDRRLLRARLPDGYVISRDKTKRLSAVQNAVNVVAVHRSEPVSARHRHAIDRDPRANRYDNTMFGVSAQGALKRALDADRLVIDNVTPHVNQGRFAVKLTLGRGLDVQADVFMDGHAPLAVSLLWRAADQTHWHQVPMRHLGNDRWQGQCVPERLGRHYYSIQARAYPDDPRHISRQCAVFPLQVERREAQYSNWYELFPRSMGLPGQHGTLRDVIEQLPRIHDMGFNVLYFPPIHPIGHTNRKGRNNTLTAMPGDPGSPYAIGSEDGGHDAIHPELGTIDDFVALVAAARRFHIDIALDFAIQCSPDHPWLREHPEWFHWREDGTVQYAENPPKRYEDIVNPDFYSATASVEQRMALWRALRDIVLFWVEQGVRTFRVDNPHTKPLPFWEWMIAEVQRRHPDVVFLSEAFTRPAMMRRLAKLGFSQSYTYFTWRNAKAELIAYLNELASPTQRDYFRPHFFVNTPDINPYFLQTSGRAGFLIRAALAATTSGLWGMYSGFELCEADALPGREEYQDSEKYELRTRDWDQPGNITAEITRLNAIRRTSPALQSHTGIRFHDVDDERVLFFSKTTSEGDNVVLVAISLSPWNTITVELPLAAWNRTFSQRPGMRLRSLWDEHDQSVVTDGLSVTLTPQLPFVLWSVQP